ncbi:MAG: cupin domain-containing protein [Anaerocolumna sp.]
MYYYDLKNMPNLVTKQDIQIKEVNLENVMMTFMEFEPYTEIESHKHQNEQITIVIKGKAEFIVNGEEKILSEGEICVLPSNVEHSVKILDEDTILYDCWSPIREDYIVR